MPPPPEHSTFWRRTIGQFRCSAVTKRAENMMVSVLIKLNSWSKRRSNMIFVAANKPFTLYLVFFQTIYTQILIEFKRYVFFIRACNYKVFFFYKFVTRAIGSYHTEECEKKWYRLCVIVIALHCTYSMRKISYFPEQRTSLRDSSPRHPFLRAFASHRVYE